MTLLLEILVALLVVLLAYYIYNHFKLKQLAHQMQQLADEAERSKQQALTEQRRNQQLKQEMTNNIAHELKTPVSSIRGYLEILLGDKPVSAEQQQYFLQRSYTQTLRLSNLINDVGLINKLEEGQNLFPKEPLKIYGIAEEAVKDLENKLDERHIVVDNKIAPSLSIVGNHDLVYAIFRNLIDNVATHAGQNLKIIIETYKEDDDSAYFHFADNGSGVDNQYLSRIFDRFLRIDEGRSRQLGGSGLGLAIVKHSVQFHGGDIYARNCDGGGLEFFFSLNKK